MLKVLRFKVGLKRVQLLLIGLDALGKVAVKVLLLPLLWIFYQRCFLSLLNFLLERRNPLPVLPDCLLATLAPQGHFGLHATSLPQLPFQAPHLNLHFPVRLQKVFCLPRLVLELSRERSILLDSESLNARQFLVLP